MALNSYERYGMADTITKHRMKLLLAAKILEVRRQMITSKSLSEVSKTNRTSTADKLKLMQPAYFKRGELLFHSNTGRMMQYSLTEKANETIKEHLTKAA